MVEFFNPRGKTKTVKRYAFGTHYVNTAPGQGYGIPAIVLSKSGEFVKHSDYERLKKKYETLLLNKCRLK
ncbi:hypothetical protein [Advenella sp. EE-W14]|uniref:hypothetical protein n=1 Tax=Advenella sp. EE-W14 TaxID=2722705 RepID=UPI00145F0F5C|nr:hypothetical protein [Advenella sp. EE-W14]